ncbi:bifunctional 4-hydroxy-2-oxoglutarate aldolase/2-dehydro-3-deoxy-phosphogluconate aldolase [Marinitenerispora sediminis]|uniref:Aldolase n=1 Tax=Marinitenerispora sediminis TaxID=1931232 RepID=A0A368T285_9ACTN|nr:bifunctional 4-hydroxy-2-oxoglutarate aldolase/2-dehydro-3-deoxy-phosphogluconate aldolase [Marinitenerispora sediminis]RCV49202.1 aldolase [Marinitenerispora sediminis]RCV51535.1 aldolase [Marinitenerispora sediminis]RCV55116.1 aldolase [Marinitenerispora sediminis]
MTTPTPTPEAVLAAIAEAVLLPVLRTSGVDATLEAAGRLADAGLGVVELTTSIPGWPDAVRAVRARFPEVTVGVGTVTGAADARRALDEGAAFLVSPYAAPEVREVAGAGVLFLEGGFTPGEVAAALRAGGAAKLFPAHVGGPRYLRGLLDVLPDARIVPTGGIAVAEAGEWLAAGALAVGVGRALLDDPDLGARLTDLRARRAG